MRIKLIDFGGKAPKRAHYNDAGADVFVHLKNLNGQNKVRIRKNSSMRIPLGIGLEVPDGYAAFVFPRSGLSSKGITCELPPIDSGYRGEISAIVTNNTDVDIWIEDGERVGQLVVVPVVVGEFAFGNLGDERGEAAYGSTGAL